MLESTCFCLKKAQKSRYEAAFLKKKTQQFI